MSANPTTTGIPPQLPLAPEAPKPLFKLRWGLHLAIMAALPVIAAFGGATSHGSGPALTHSVAGLLRVCLFEVLFFAIPFGLAWLISRPSLEDLLLRWRPGWWVLPLGALYSVAIRMAAGIAVMIGLGIYLVSTHASPAEVQNFATANRPQVEKLVDMEALAHNPAYFWLSVVLVSAVVGGLREELWRSSFLAGLRSLWPRTFGSTGGGVAGAAIAALFFGAGHLPQGLLAAAIIGVVGFLLGVIMTLHRSVWPSVIAHSLFDAASIAMLPWAMQHFQELQRVTG